MSSQKGRLFAEKHGQDAQPDPMLAKEIQKRVKDQALPCAVALEVANDLKASPQEVGKTADLLNISLSKCQLGLFGYKPNKKIVKAENTTNQDLIDAIKGSLLNDRLPCEAAWKIAARFKATKLKVRDACQANGIKIKPCQLGVF